MILKVYNNRKQLLCTYNEGVKLPSVEDIDSMQSEGYIFEADDRKISAKKLKELIKNGV